VITDPSYFSSFKRLDLAKDHLTLEQKYKILESLYEEARMLGSFRKDDILLGLKDTLRLAAALNSYVSRTPR
jgi:hypothetical protein